MKLFVDLIFWPVWGASILTNLLWRRGYVSAWATRNVDRIYTLTMIATVVVRAQEGHPGRTVFWTVGAIFAVLGWNRPRDDDDKRNRRKRKVAEKKEDLSMDWSGMEPTGT